MSLRRPNLCVTAGLAVVSATSLGAAHASAQPDPTWNDERVLALVERGRVLRRSAVVDPDFRSYQAEARGYVYFFFDRPDTGGRNLVKADQVALDVYWQAPSSAAQHLVGRRDEKALPTDIRYHVDHLTIVQDDFGDYIRMGDGDEVEAVLHPIGPSSSDTYDFLLADSLTLSYGGGSEEVRVYQVRVRPKSFDRPGFVGTVYLDRANAAIVRMNFSFTPASYVDSYLDYIRVSLDNSLWLGRHWLPYRQEVEIRREIPLLDFMAGSVIRGRFQIRDYEFNRELPESLFRRRINRASPAQQAAFAFERGLFDDLDREGLEPSPSIEEVRREVDRIVEDRALSGLAPLRLHVGALSEVARYNRAEGLRVGGGLTLRPEGELTVRTSGAYSFGRERVSADVTATRIGPGPAVPTLELYWDRLGDVGGYPGAETLVNTISSVSGEEDFTDPFFRRGVTLTVGGSRSDAPSVALTWEEHRSARDVVSDDLADTGFRPVRSVDEGVLGSLAVRVPVALPVEGLAARFTGKLGRLESRTFATLEAETRWDLREPERPWHASVSLAGGGVTDEAPAQSLYLLGGRWTLPGHDYRSFAGDTYVLMRGEGTYALLPPYLGVRVIGAVGATSLGTRDLPADWAVGDSDGLRGSVGAGLSIGWDAVRLDVAHGVRGGGWEALISVAQQFRAWL